MKVLEKGKKGKIRFVGKVCRCGECRCKFKIQKKDIRKIKLYSVESFDVDVLLYEINCPQCGEGVDL